jgi:hypothetical protein
VLCFSLPAAIFVAQASSQHGFRACGAPKKLTGRLHSATVTFMLSADRESKKNGNSGLGGIRMKSGTRLIVSGLLIALSLVFAVEIAV